MIPRAFGAAAPRGGCAVVVAGPDGGRLRETVEQRTLIEALGMPPGEFREMQTSIIRLRDRLTEHANAEA